ncbi:helix-turn-helix domain-containing protein [Kineococcus arenarius]|uniref:helix-turn-helix domain-containing protein n=1 Tax=Kineococcus sp. SYSU DK007 TaxID=3383128 RepID=UPI003D7C75E1
MKTLLDPDTQAVTGLLRAAVTDSGLSQAAFARALGTSAPRLSTYLSGTTCPSARFCARASRLGRALRAAAARGLMSAPTTAALMRRHLLAGEVEWVWRALLQGRDHLTLLLAEESRALQPRPGPVLSDSWEAIPGSTGAEGWDALLAAVTAHEFELAGTGAPSWTRREALQEPWTPEHPFLSTERVRAQTPAWLRRWNVYVPERDLTTA